LCCQRYARIPSTIQTFEIDCLLEASWHVVPGFAGGSLPECCAAGISANDTSTGGGDV
jgi:hypothetical protein